MSLRTSLFALCLLSFGGIAQAGAVFRVTVENYAEDNQFFEGGESYVTVTKIEGNRMRSDTQGENGEMATTVIFLGETDEMYMIDHEEKSYIVMDRESMEALGKQMSEVMQQMQAALAQIPPEQREMMERMMKDKMAADPNYKPPSPPVVRSTGESGSVNGIACEWKEVTRDDVLSERACVCDQSEIVGGHEMVAIAHEMKDFAEALREMANSVSSMPAFGGGTMGDFALAMTPELGGFSLISEDFDGEGKLMRRSTFQSADQVSIPDEEFTPPSGYKRQTMQGMTR
ncbi:MAG TPA: DUF4412 domain-containing protein [Vicinamibacteria bacterium]|jgi:hypothetical protein